MLRASLGRGECYVSVCIVSVRAEAHRQMFNLVFYSMFAQRNVNKSPYMTECGKHFSQYDELNQVYEEKNGQSEVSVGRRRRI